MGFIGKQPAKAPLTSSDIANDIINSDHLGDTAISGFSALSVIHQLFMLIKVKTKILLEINTFN